jgi:tRNA-specific 2-thiouridylase
MSETRKERVVVAMSGGVDSSVTAALLLERGYDVVGLFMRSGIHAGEAAKAGKQGCCSIDDAMDARQVAASLGVPFFAVNFSVEFERIINYFVDEYERGRTPNPCVQCNRWLKFGRLLDYADEIGARWVATGHYARIVQRGGRRAIAKGLDGSKDQSYVLFPLDQRQLERTMLPIGEMQKVDVRAIAAKIGLKVSEKPDSQEICFVPDQNYGRLLGERRPGSIKKGPLVDTAGKVLGEHLGHQLYTIGQRKGLGALGRPMYVVETRPETNTVVVGDARETESIGLIAGDLIWGGIDRIPPGVEISGGVKVRYRQDPCPAKARISADGRVEITFDEPLRAVTPGQAAVFYDGDVVLFGGFIDHALTRPVEVRAADDRGPLKG